MTRCWPTVALWCGICLVAYGVPLHAQTTAPTSRLEVSIGPAVLVANEATWGAEFGVRWQPPESRRFSVRIGAVLKPARADSTSPAVTSLGIQGVLATRDLSSTSAPTLLLSFGVGRTRLDARLQEHAIAACTPATGCMYEDAQIYHTGTYFTWEPGLALRLPLSTHFTLTPNTRALITRGHSTWGRQSVISFAMSGTWQP